MHRAIQAALLICVICTVTVGQSRGAPAAADGLPKPELPDAQALIRACWDKSEADRKNSDAARQYAGYDRTAGCLEDTIMGLLDPLGFGTDELKRPEARQQLADIRTASRRLYAAIYSDGGDCAGDCGPNTDTRPLLRHVTVLENILADVIRTAALHTGQWETLPPPTRPVPAIPDAAFASFTGLAKPKALIDACWAISLKDRWGNNARIREGNLKTVLCLKERVLKLQEERKLGSSTLSRNQTDQELDRLSFAVQRFYWAIGNDHTYCRVTCGSIWFSYHLPPVSQILSDVIRVMVAQAAAVRTAPGVSSGHSQDATAAALSPSSDLPDPDELIRTCRYVAEDEPPASDPRPPRIQYLTLTVCLERTIEEQLDALGFQSVSSTRRETTRQMSEINDAVRTLYSMIYTESSSCNGRCGAQTDTRDLERLAAIYETILRDMIDAASYPSVAADKPKYTEPHPPVIPDAEFRPTGNLPHPKALIDACTAATEKEPATGDTFQSGTISCLESTVLKLREDLKFGGSARSDDRAQEALAKLRHNAKRLYLTIHQDNPRCRASCGKPDSSQLSRPVANILSDMIRVMIAQAATNMGQLQDRKR